MLFAVILLVVIAMWAVVLGPGLLRRRAESRSTHSIGTFHRQLGVLQRTGPSLVPPAHRLGTIQPLNPAGGLGSTGFPVVSSRPGLIVVRPDTMALQAPSPSETRRPDPYFRSDACKRRRDVLLGLAIAAGATLLLGFAFTPMLYLAALATVLLVSYVGLLVYLRNLAMERETKLRYLPEHIEHDPGILVRRVAAR